MKTIGIVGGSGFVGKYLSALLEGRGYRVIIFTRNGARKPESENITYAAWDAVAGTADITALEQLDAVVYLAGAGVAEKRWTTERKKEIVDSRVSGTEFLLGKLKAHGAKCKTFIAASAIGYYGPDVEGKSPFTETDAAHNDFLGATCKQWEDASLKAAETIRTVIFRIGIVLGKESGAFPELAKPMEFGIMPILASGKQMVSWISVQDLARMMVFAIEDSNLRGIYNAVAPKPVSHKTLMETIARYSGGHKLSIPVPSFVLRIMLGEMSVEILKSCTVSGEKISATGFTYALPDLDATIKKILAK